MSVEAGIHEQWEADTALVALVPAEFVYTGWVPPRDANHREIGLPYASVKFDVDEVQRPSGAGRLLSGTVTISVWDETLDGAKAIKREVLRVYRRGEFTYAEGVVQDMLETDQVTDQMDDGTWMLEQAYQIRAQEPNQ